MVTSLDDRESRLRGLQAGAEEFVTKPLDRIELGARVRNLLRLKAYGDSLARREAEMRVMVDRLEAANRDLESFSYSVSHDLRAPLGAIEGFTRALQEDYAEQLPAGALHLFDRVRANAGHMSRLIEDLLEFARTGRQAVVHVPVDLREVAGRVLAGLEEEISTRKVEVRMGELPRCDADPVLMTQVFQNLLSNALKYTRMRERAVIEIGCEDLDGERAIYVRDNGTGFDMRHAGKLFGVFQRLHSASEFEGTGVGLAIVQRIIQHHGGRVWAAAKAGEGASFHFTIPASGLPGRA
jgi:light-regulated signal transduction histidine kinase (bacteriophytochrome)